MLQHKTSNCVDRARLDNVADNYWEDGHRACFDVRVFYPAAQSYCQTSLDTCYRSKEREKRHSYEEWVHGIERVTFPPLGLHQLRWDGLNSHIQENGIPDSGQEETPLPSDHHWWFTARSLLSWSDCLCGVSEDAVPLKATTDFKSLKMCKWQVLWATWSSCTFNFNSYMCIYGTDHCMQVYPCVVWLARLSPYTPCT